MLDFNGQTVKYIIILNFFFYIIFNNKLIKVRINNSLKYFFIFSASILLSCFFIKICI